MLAIKREKSFLKDMAKVKMSDTQYAKYISYLSKLIHKEILPPQSYDHPLSGEWSDAREFHIGGDLLVIYMLTLDTLILIRIGSHAQLFKNM